MSGAVTQWFIGRLKPVHIGWYNATHKNNVDARRWWNGTLWSRAVFPFHSRAEVAAAKAIPALSALQNFIAWRGLAERP